MPPVSNVSPSALTTFFFFAMQRLSRLLVVSYPVSLSLSWSRPFLHGKATSQQAVSFFINQRHLRHGQWLAPTRQRQGSAFVTRLAIDALVLSVFTTGSSFTCLFTCLLVFFKVQSTREKLEVLKLSHTKESLP